MSSKLKLTLVTLFLLQLVVLAWSYFSKSEEDKTYHLAIGQYLENPEKVQHLDLSNMNLRKVPKEITQFKNLVSLNLSNNRFRKVPDEIYKLPYLKFLNLSNNRIKEIELQDHKSIERLNLSYNQIDYIDYHPCHFGCMTALRTVDVSHNKLEECPTFNNSSSIDTIILSNNLLNSFYNLHMSLPENIGYLDISNNRIEGIDEDLYAFIGFDYDDLTTLADKCESINLSNNSFEYFPYEIFRSEKIEKVIMTNCKFKVTNNTTPYFFAKNLRYLDLSNTSEIITNLDINDFETLETLIVENTNFEDFLINLPYLNELNIKGLKQGAYYDVRGDNINHLEINYDKLIALTNQDLEQIPNLQTIVIANYQEDENLIARLEAYYSDVTIILE